MKIIHLRITLCRIIMLAMGGLMIQSMLDNRAVLAQTTPFLTSPYYGGANITQGWSSAAEPNHHAYDFDLNYQPILAADAGTMAAVGWFNTTCHAYNGNDANIGLNCGFGLFIRIDHSNGYSTYYAHLSSAAVALTNGVAASVQAGQIIGNSGATGWTMGASANTPGPHLHFETRNNAHTTQVDPFNPNLWKDGQWSTPSRPMPALVNGGETAVDDNDANTGGFYKGSGSPPNNQCTGNCGGWTRADNLYWSTSNLVIPNSWARWQPSIPNGGAIYEVLVYIPAVNALPDADASTTWLAPYTVQYSDGTNVVTSVAYVDQRGSRGRWISIGSYYMDSTSWVQLTNASGEATGTRRLGADSVKFIRRSTTYVPDSKFGNGWSNKLWIQSNGGTATVLVKCYDNNGFNSGNTLATIPAHLSTLISCSSPSVNSVVVDASQNVSIAAFNQRNLNAEYSSGAFSGVSAANGSTLFYIPLAARQLAGATGTLNTEILVQNGGQSNLGARIYLVNTDGTTKLTKDIIATLGQAFRYDLTNEPALNTGWYGSAVIFLTSGSKMIASSNFNTVSGSSLSVQSINGLSGFGTTLFAPLVAVQLSNGLNTPISVQNVSGVQIPANRIQLSCTKDPNSAGSNFSVTNGVAIPTNAAYFFNPVANTPAFPSTNWYGSCRIISLDNRNIVAFVQMRYTAGNTLNAAAYEAMPSAGTNKSAFFPLYQKLMTGGWATAIIIQNLSSTSANVTFVYTGNAGAQANCTATIADTIPGYGSRIHNHRITSGSGSVSQLGTGCTGTLLVTSDQPIDGFIQLTNVNNPAGDTFMSHNAITTP